MTSKHTHLFTKQLYSTSFVLLALYVHYHVHGYNLISFLLLSITGHDSHGRWSCSFLGHSWGTTECRHQSGSKCNWTTRGDAYINPFTSPSLGRSYTKCLITTLGGTSKECHTILGGFGDIISVRTLKLCYLIGLDIPLTTLTCCG